MLVGRQRHVRARLRDEAGAQLQLELLHLVVMQVLLDQEALSPDSRLHVRRDVRDQPRHEELHHKHHVLRNKHTVHDHNADVFIRCEQDEAELTYLHDDDEGHLGCQDVPELHGGSVLPLMARRVAVVPISARHSKQRRKTTKGFSRMNFIYSYVVFCMFVCVFVVFIGLNCKISSV